MIWKIAATTVGPKEMLMGWVKSNKLRLNRDNEFTQIVRTQPQKGRLIKKNQV